MKTRLVAASMAAIVVLLAPRLARAQEDPQEWVRRCQDRDDRNRHQCEVREFTLPAEPTLRADANPNGAIRVKVWDKREVRVVAKVDVHGHSQAEAQELAGRVKVETGPGEVRSSGPHDLNGHRGWSVSYDIWVPAGTGLRLRSTNGSLGVEGVNGSVDAETTNGGIELQGVTGEVRAESTNGSITIAVGGTTWKGGGIEAETTNGGIRLVVPGGFSADLDVETTNGGISVDFPVQVQGRIGKHLRTKLGDGGPLVRLETVNGGVSIRSR